MNAKSIIAAAAIAVSLGGFSATQANADVNVDFGIGFVSPDLAIGISSGHHGHHGHGFVEVDLVPHHWGISCSEGRWVVKSAGFRKVKTKECDGSSYTYTGKKHGDWYKVRVSRSSGDIISIREIL